MKCILVLYFELVLSNTSWPNDGPYFSDINATERISSPELDYFEPNLPQNLSAPFLMKIALKLIFSGGGDVQEWIKL
jgi:hypothetical protein